MMGVIKALKALADDEAVVHLAAGAVRGGKGNAQYASEYVAGL